MNDISEPIVKFPYETSLPKVMRGGLKTIETNGFPSNHFWKKPVVQLYDIRYNSGDTSSQSQIDEYHLRMKKGQSGGSIYDSRYFVGSSLQPKDKYGYEYMYNNK